DGFDANQHLSRSRLRNLQLNELKNLRPSVALNLYGFHYWQECTFCRRRGKHQSHNLTVDIENCDIQSRAIATRPSLVGNEHAGIHRRRNRDFFEIDHHAAPAKMAAKLEMHIRTPGAIEDVQNPIDRIDI